MTKTNGRWRSWSSEIGGVGVILYLVLLVTLGVITSRKGQWVMFIIGFFLPLFWLIGALLPPVRERY